MKPQNKKTVFGKNTKEKVKKGMNGAISIFLCLLMTPFLSISLGLVEYARYQEVIEITEELLELAGISELTDYDKYLHNRFGVLATSQENDLNTASDTYLTDNASVLGNQIKISDVSATGKLSLDNYDVLRRQIVDVSELSTTTAVIVNDLNLDVLLDKLSNISGFADAMNTMDKLADVTDSISSAVTAIENLKASIDTLTSNLSSAISSAETLANKLGDLINKLGENGIQLPQNATQEEISAAIASFDESYVSDLKAVYSQAQSTITSFNNVKTQLDDVKTKADEVITAVNTAKTKFDSLSTSNSLDSDGSIGNQAVRTLDDVLDDMVTLVDETLVDIKTTTIDTAKATLNNIINTTLEDTGLSALTRYNSNYFKLPLSDNAKTDVVELLKVVQDVYSTRSGDAIKDYLKGKFKPNLNFSSLANTVQNIINEASKSLVYNVTDKVSETLKKLVNAVKSLFDLEIFYDPDLNAFVNTGGRDDSGYQSFLEALGKMLSAAENFSTSGLNVIEALKAIGEMFVAIKDLIFAVMEIAGDMIASIGELAGSTVTADVRGLYEKMLISGYMVHNLPSRTSYVQSIPGIQGTGLTGFDYSKIPVCSGSQSSSGKEEGKTAFESLANTIKSIQNGAGTDKMFEGAELEYIRAGTNSEIANQIFCFFDIYFLRLVLGLPAVFVDTEVTTLAASTTVAAWLVYIIYILVEPFLDTILLVNGASVQLVKTECWLTASGIMDFLTKLGDQVMSQELRNTLTDFASNNANQNDSSTKEGSFSFDPTDLLEVDYSTHMLMVLLVFVDSEKQINRLKDIMGLEASLYYENNGKSFSMTKAYSAVEVSANVLFNPFFELTSSSLGTRMSQTVSY